MTLKVQPGSFVLMSEEAEEVDWSSAEEKGSSKSGRSRKKGVWWGGYLVGQRSKDLVGGRKWGIVSYNKPKAGGALPRQGGKVSGDGMLASAQRGIAICKKVEEEKVAVIMATGMTPAR